MTKILKVTGIEMKVTNKTRAGHEGRFIECPHCGKPKRVYGFLWNTLECGGCKKVVKKTDWTIPKSSIGWKDIEVGNKKNYKVVQYRRVRRRGKKVTEIKVEGNEFRAFVPAPFYTKGRRVHPLAAQVVLALLEDRVHCPECCLEKSYGSGQACQKNL